MLILILNQLQNTDFEAWSFINSDVPFAWDTLKNTNAQCSFQRETTNKRIGSYSIKITINQTTTGYDCAIGQAKGVSPNTNYNISAWVYDNDPNAYAQMYVACYDNTNNQVAWSFVGSQSSDNPSWQQLSGSYTTPNNCSYIDVQIRVYDTGIPGGSIYLDGISLTTGSPAGELSESFAGTFPPAGWMEVDLGTASGGFLQKRTSACPVSGDLDCFGIKYRQQDSDSSISGVSYLMTPKLDFSSTAPETLTFYWRVNNTGGSINSKDSIRVEISTDLGNSWMNLWKWDGTLSTSPNFVSIPLDDYNGLEQVLVRFAYYKNSSNGDESSISLNRFFNIDSIRVRNSYVNRFNRLTNSSFENWLYTTSDMMPDYWRRWNNRAPEDAGRSAQLWIKRDNFSYSGNYSVKAFFTTILNPFIEQKFPNPFSNCAGSAISQVDSFVAVSSIRFYDDDQNGKARTGIVWYYGTNTQSNYPNNYTTDQDGWQVYGNTAKFIGPAQGGNNFDSIAFRIRFYNQGELPNAEEGAVIFADSLNFKLYCYVGNTTPVDVVEYQFNDYISYIRINNFGLEVLPKKIVSISIYLPDGRKIYRGNVDRKVFILLKSGLYILQVSENNKLIMRRKFLVR